MVLGSGLAGYEVEEMSRVVRRVGNMVVLDGGLVGRIDQHGSSISFHTPLKSMIGSPHRTWILLCGILCRDQCSHDLGCIGRGSYP